MPSGQSENHLRLSFTGPIYYPYGRSILERWEERRGRGAGKLLSQLVRHCGKNGVKTIAFPAISCGAYGYPMAEAAKIAIATTREFLQAHSEMGKVIFAVLGDEIFAIYRELL